jgi:DNA-binding response OmpR family regulator
MTKMSSCCHFRVTSAIVARLEMRILVVDDKPGILAFVSRGLEAEGFAVDSAVDGPSALQAVERARYDAVVLDILVHGVDGLAVLEELKRAQPSLPVVVLSARADLATKLRSFQLGASDYLAKPFALDELIARIWVHLRVAHAQLAQLSLLTAGRLTVDLGRRQARLGECVTDLSNREFRLLQHLVLHAGEVVSRQRLLADVWGYQFDPGSNVVDVCVRRLRKKLGEDAPIETVRHVGYRLVDA